ncbi:MAG: hypothetical protein FWD31_14155 [Planctomycetaceae bacterium]|nr:hypothetical protein [Planctomycetaceae bacterium]
MERLIEYLEQNQHGFHFEDHVTLDFARCSGHYVICNCTRKSESYYRPKSKTFWVQQAAGRYIFATWLNIYYMIDDETTLINVVNEVFQDEAIPGAPYSLPKHYLEKFSICELASFSLIKNDTLEKYNLTHENARDWYCEQGREEDWLCVTHRKIREFLDLHCEYSMNEHDWVDYSCEGVRGHFRLPPIPLDETCRLEITIDAAHWQTPEGESLIRKANAFFDGIFV